jgi:hypothetical protein
VIDVKRLVGHEAVVLCAQRARSFFQAARAAPVTIRAGADRAASKVELT